MKRKDFIQVLFISVIAGIVSFIVGGIFITGPKTRNIKAPVVEKLSNDFPAADMRVFNDKALDPTKDITINSNNNPQPFNNR